LALASLALLAAACNDNGGKPAASNNEDSGPADGGPSSSGAIVPNTFLTFEGRRYELKDILQADLLSDQFTEVGTASEADVDYENELKVYTKAGEDAAVYTYTAAVDGSGEEGDVPATWAKWEAAD